MAKAPNWTQEKLAILDAEYPTCKSIQALADMLGRSINSVHHQASKRGIKRDEKVRMENWKASIAARGAKLGGYFPRETNARPCAPDAWAQALKVSP